MEIIDIFKKNSKNLKKKILQLITSRLFLKNIFFFFKP